MTFQDTPNDVSSRRLLVVCCFGRSGSSLVWHALASTPDAIAVDGEFHQVLFSRARWARFLFRATVSSTPRFFGRFLSQWVWKCVVQSAERCVIREPYVWKTASERYQTWEVRKHYVCFKMMGLDIKLCDFLRKQFDDVHFVGLVRDGRAMLEGWQRRGMPVKVAIRRYKQVCEEMLYQASNHDDFHLIRYEDFVADPFAETHRLWKALKLEPRPDNRIMVKMKGVSTNAGYRNHAGRGSDVIYISPEEVHEVVVQEANQAQIAKLRSEDLDCFVKKTQEILQRLGYLEMRTSFDRDDSRVS